MNDYLQKQWIRSFILATILSLLSCLVDFRIGVGIMLGSVFSILNFIMVVFAFSKVMDYRSTSKLSVFTSFLFRMIVLAIPLALGIFLPNLVNIYGAVAGILLNKIVMYIDSIFFRKG